MSDHFMREIIGLADRVDPDPEAVWEWFFETPLLPHGKTARELVQADRGDAVVAFLTRTLRDIDPGSRSVVSRAGPGLGIKQP
ncbi:MAG: hypothetical protein ABI268_02745 [Rhodanobacter sp.]